MIEYIDQATNNLIMSHTEKREDGTYWGLGVAMTAELCFTDPWAISSVRRRFQKDIDEGKLEKIGADGSVVFTSYTREELDPPIQITLTHVSEH